MLVFNKKKKREREKRGEKKKKKRKKNLFRGWGEVLKATMYHYLLSLTEWSFLGVALGGVLLFWVFFFCFTVIPFKYLGSFQAFEPFWSNAYKAAVSTVQCLSGNYSDFRLVFWKKLEISCVRLWILAPRGLVNILCIKSCSCSLLAQCVIQQKISL